MLAQRIYGLALGYEDLHDHEELRNYPLLGMLAGRRDLQARLAGKSTLNRLELTPAGSPSAERYNKISYSCEAIDALLVDLFLEAQPQAPREIVLDLDATGTPHVHPLQQRVSLAETLRRGLHGSALLKKPASSQNRSLVPRSRGSACKNRSIATPSIDKRQQKQNWPAAPASPAENKPRSPTPQRQLTTGEKSGLEIKTLRHY